MCKHSNLTLFTTICVILIALFINVWIIVLSVISFFFVKHLKSVDKPKKEEEEASQPAEKSAPKGEFSMKAEMADTDDFISQSDIDSLLNEDKEDPFAVKDPV